MASFSSFMAASVSANEQEYAIKAGFIYNFARYSDGRWFNSNRFEHYIICSFDPKFVLTASKTLVGKKVKNRTVEVHLVSRKGRPDASCNTFFLAEPDYDLLTKVVNNSELSRSMLIGEKAGFLEAGGHINLFLNSGKVRFEVDAHRLKQAGIQMSSQVLRLGRVLGGEE